MSSQPRPAYYTFTTTHGHQASVYVPPDDDPWQAATHYARASVESDSHLAELRIASEVEIAGYSVQLKGAQMDQYR